MLAALALALVTLPPRDDASSLKAAHEQAKLCAKATVDGDFEALIAKVHPAAVKGAGGKEKMLKILTDGMAQMKAEGWAIKEVTVEPAKSLIRSGGTVYCILPETILMTGKKKVTARSFLIGASDNDGKTWTYIDGAPGEAEIRKHFPEIPKGLKFPAKQKPVVEAMTPEKAEK